MFTTDVIPSPFISYLSPTLRDTCTDRSIACRTPVDEFHESEYVRPHPHSPSMTRQIDHSPSAAVTSNHHVSQVQFRTSKRDGYGNGYPHAVGLGTTKHGLGTGSGGGGVHVQMETFTRAEDEQGEETLTNGAGTRKVLLTLESGETVVLGGGDDHSEKGGVLGV
jgi:hypothetical protein